MIVFMNPAFLKRPNSKKTLPIDMEGKGKMVVGGHYSLSGMCYKIGYVTLILECWCRMWGHLVLHILILDLTATLGDHTKIYSTACYTLIF